MNTIKEDIILYLITISTLANGLTAEATIIIMLIILILFNVK